MFRSSSPDSPLDPRLEKIFAEISRDVFGTEEELRNLDFPPIEHPAHTVGRKVAQRLIEDATTKQAESAGEPQPCPQCKRLCSGSIESRELLTQDGPIRLQEAEHYCSHCRRAFFPQQRQATLESSSLQPGGSCQGGLHGNRDSLVRGGHQGSADQHLPDDLAASPSDPLPRSRRGARR